MTAGSGLFNEGPQQARYIEAKGGVAGEVDDLRRDLNRNLHPLAAVSVAEFINPLAGGAATLRVATATVTTATTVLAAALTALTLANMLDAPRQIVFTTAGATPAHAPATATITGTDVRGKRVVEAVALAQTATTATSKNAFASIEKIEFTAGDGTAATVAIGTGTKIGLKYAPKMRSGGSFAPIIREFQDGAAPTAGVITAGANDLPYGTYAPNSAPNGALDFLVFYEFDASV